MGVIAGNISGSGDITAVTSITTEGTLKVSGSMTFGDNCADVATFGAQISASCDVDVAGNIDVYGTTAAHGNLSISGSTTAQAVTVTSLSASSGVSFGDNIDVHNNAVVGGDLSVSGSTTFTSISGSNLALAGNAEIYGTTVSHGNLSVSGSTTLGNTSADVTSLVSQVTASQGIVITGGTGGKPRLTVGDATAEDTMIVLDGNAVEFRLGIENSTNTFEFGVGTTAGAGKAMTFASNGTTKFFFPVSASKGLSIGDNIDVHNNAVVGGDLSVSGSTSAQSVTFTSISGSNFALAGNAEIYGTTVAHGNLSVSGSTTAQAVTATSFSGSNLALSGNAEIYGTTVAHGNLSVSGSTTAQAVTATSLSGSNLALSDNAEIYGTTVAHGNLSVSGSTTAQAVTVTSLSGSNLALAGNAEIYGTTVAHGNLSVSGSSTFGDSCADVTTFASQITASCDVDIAGNFDVYGAGTVHGALNVSGSATLVGGSATQIALDVNAVNSTADVIDITANALTTGTALNIQGNALTTTDSQDQVTGSLIHCNSHAPSTSARTLVSVVNDNRASVDTALFTLYNFAPQTGDEGIGATALIQTRAASETNPILVLENASNDANPPILEFNKSQLYTGAASSAVSHATGSDDDYIGRLRFVGGNDTVEDLAEGPEAEEITYAQIEVQSTDVTNADEGGKITFKVMAGGTGGTAAEANLFSIGGEDVANATKCEVVVNDDSIDCDFRVETNGQTHMLFADAGTNRIGIGTGNPTQALTVAGTISGSAAFDLAGNTEIYGDAAVHGNLSVSGSSTFGDSCADVATFVSQITASCDVDIAGNFDVQSNAVVGGDLSVSGSSHFAGRVIETLTKTDVDNQVNTLVAAQIKAGIVIHTSQTGGGTVTMDTASNIISGVPLTKDNQAVKCYYINDGNQDLTFANDAGNTTQVHDTGAILMSDEGVTLLFVRESNSAVRMYTLGGGAAD